MSKINEEIETNDVNTMDNDIIKPKKITKLSRNAWFTIVTLAIVGEIAWAIENTWFNVYYHFHWSF
ncbi:MAG: hypothetical protein ACTSQ5_14760 [Promethearchaeota archaeon]